MRIITAILGLAILAAPAGATEHESWAAYMKENRYECPGPLDTLAKPRMLTIAGKKYLHTGYKLEVQDPDADKKVKIGVVSAIKDISPGTKHNLRKAIAWFKKERVEWVLANGDLALEELDLEDVIDLLGDSGLPILVVLGNSESRGSWARAYKDRVDKYPNLINGTWVRQIVADDVEFWTVSGYHDRRFVHQGAGCLYKEADIETTQEGLTPAGKAPVMLVAHGPPRCKGKRGIDKIFEGNNVGDPLLTALIKKSKIPFGIFGHILESGGTAVGRDLTRRAKPNKMLSSFYLNAGSLSGDPWGMNDGSTSTGMAVLVTVENKKAKFQFKRFKPPPEE